MKNRVIYKDNTTINDWSVALNDYYQSTADATLVASEDNVFIGSTLPFNHFYVEVVTANSTTSAIDVDLWDGDEWVNVAQVIDETASSGKTLAQSGFISWIPDKNEGWSRDDTVDAAGSEQITGLGGIKIYDLFWAKITFNTSPAYFKLGWIGNIFSTDYNLYSEYPELKNSSLIAAFDSGKTTWKEQHYLAAQVVIKDLLQRKTIVDSNQILDRDDLCLAATSKCAQIIFTALGDDYVDQAKKCEDEYNRRLSTAYTKIDINANARVDAIEQRPYQFQNRLYR